MAGITHYSPNQRSGYTLPLAMGGRQNENKSVESLINYELGKVIEWLNINKLSFKKEKSKYMICLVPRKETQTPILNYR